MKYSFIRNIAFNEGLLVGLFLGSVVFLLLITIRTPQTDLANFEFIVIIFSACLAGYFTLRGIRSQIIFQIETYEDQIRRKERSHKARMPLVIADFYRASRDISLWHFSHEREDFPIKALQASHESHADLSQLVEFTNEESALYISNILRVHQILTTRMDIYIHGDSEFSMYKENFMNLDKDFEFAGSAADWMAFTFSVEKLFKFIRGEVSVIDSDLGSVDDYTNILMFTDYDVSNYSALNKRLKGDRLGKRVADLFNI